MHLADLRTYFGTTSLAELASLTLSRRGIFLAQQTVSWHAVRSSVSIAVGLFQLRTWRLIPKVHLQPLFAHVIGLGLQPALKVRFGFVSVGRYVFESRDMVERLEISGHHEGKRFAHIGRRRIGVVPGKQ